MWTLISYKMNFGPKANDAFKNQQPTYLVAPNFTTRPFPNGPLDLGTLVEDLKQYYPINQGSTNRVAIPESQRYVDIKEEVNASLKTSLGGEARILATLLDRSIGGDASLKGLKRDEDVFYIQKLETAYFHPQRSFVIQCLQLPDVKDYNDMANDKIPLYLITGLKIAWGATIYMDRGRDFEGKVKGTIQEPSGPVGVGGQATVSGESVLVSSFGKPTDFVLGIQVLKIYPKKRALFGERALKVQRVLKNAVLVDDDDPKIADVEDEVDFAIAGLDDGEIEGLIPWIGKDSKGKNEFWLLPRDVSEPRS